MIEEARKLHTFHQWLDSEPWKKSKSIGLIGLKGSSKAYLLSLWRERIRKPLLIIVPLPRDAEILVEDTFFRDGYFVTFLFPFMDEFPDYQHFDVALSPEQKRRIMSFYKSMLQRHMYATGKKYFVAKNPAFSPKIETLAEFFPDARIIYLARNPLDMLPSTVSWINYSRRVFTDPGNGYFYLDEITDFTQHWYRHPLKYIDSHPSPRYLILKYDDLIQRPEQVIRGFYEQFGYPEKPGLETIVDEAVKETLSHRSDHSYSFEEMGFTRTRYPED